MGLIFAPVWVYLENQTDLPTAAQPEACVGFWEDTVQEHATRWDRHAILAEIKRRHGSLNKFAALTPLSPSEISAALGSSYPKAERAIASALNISIQALWPDRYLPNGRRRTNPNRAQHPNSSQNEIANSVGGEAP